MKFKCSACHKTFRASTVPFCGRQIARCKCGGMVDAADAVPARHPVKWIGRQLSGIAGILTWPFRRRKRSAFEGIADDIMVSTSATSPVWFAESQRRIDEYYRGLILPQMKETEKKFASGGIVNPNRPVSPSGNEGEEAVIPLKDGWSIGDERVLIPDDGHAEKCTIDSIESGASLVLGPDHKYHARDDLVLPPPQEGELRGGPSAFDLAIWRALSWPFRAAWGVVTWPWRRRKPSPAEPSNYSAARAEAFRSGGEFVLPNANDYVPLAGRLSVYQLPESNASAAKKPEPTRSYSGDQLRRDREEHERNAESFRKTLGDAMGVEFASVNPWAQVDPVKEAEKKPEPTKCDRCGSLIKGTTFTSVRETWCGECDRRLTLPPDRFMNMHLHVPKDKQPSQVAFDMIDIPGSVLIVGDEFTIKGQKTIWRVTRKNPRAAPSFSQIKNAHSFEAIETENPAWKFYFPEGGLRGRTLMLGPDFEIINDKNGKAIGIQLHRKPTDDETRMFCDLGNSLDAEAKMYEDKPAPTVAGWYKCADCGEIKKVGIGEMWLHDCPIACGGNVKRLTTEPCDCPIPTRLADDTCFRCKRPVPNASATWTPKVGEWVVITHTDYDDPAEGDIRRVVRVTPSGNGVKIETPSAPGGFMFYIREIRPLTLAEVQNEEQARQFYGRKVQYHWLDYIGRSGVITKCVFPSKAFYVIFGHDGGGSWYSADHLTLLPDSPEQAKPTDIYEIAREAAKDAGVECTTCEFQYENRRWNICFRSARNYQVCISEEFARQEPDHARASIRSGAQRAAVEDKA